MSEIVVLAGAGDTFFNVLRALLPLLLLFLIFQFLFLKLPASYVFNLLKGVLLALVGPVLFLQGVKIGFMPAGSAMGEILGTIEHKWLMIPLGFSWGFWQPSVNRRCGYSVIWLKSLPQVLFASGLFWGPYHWVWLYW